MSLLFKIYTWLRAKYDPVKGPQIILTRNGEWIQADTKTPTKLFVGEDPQNPNTWFTMPEFSVTLPVSLENKSIAHGHIWEFLERDWVKEEEARA